MPEIHLRQPGSTYSACEQFPESKIRIQKFKETADSRYIHQNKLEIDFFKYDMAYGDFKDLTRRKVSDKILRNKNLTLLKILNMMDFKESCFSGL